MRSSTTTKLVYGAVSSALFMALSCGGEPEVLDETQSNDAVPTPTETGDDVVELTPPEETPLEVVEASIAWPRLGPPYPIVLVHGFSGFADIGPLDYFYGVVDRLTAAGAEAYAPAQPPYAPVETRAEVLAAHLDDILDATWREKAHLVCHSQGGLDCRYLVAALGYEDRVATITTIATPHGGTPLADMAAIAPDGLANPAGMFLAWMLGLLEGEPPADSAWGGDDEAAEWAPELAAAIDSMTSEGAAAFNTTWPDHPDVPVFSVGAVSNLRTGGDECAGGFLFDIDDAVDAVDALLVAPGLAISGFDLRRNDGIVPTDSMRHGTFLGCVPADHFDEVGQIADDGAGLISGFDHLVMYDRIVELMRTYEPASP